MEMQVGGVTVYKELYNNNDMFQEGIKDDGFVIACGVERHYCWFDNISKFIEWSNISEVNTTYKGDFYEVIHENFRQKPRFDFLTLCYDFDQDIRQLYESIIYVCYKWGIKIDEKNIIPMHDKDIYSVVVNNYYHASGKEALIFYNEVRDHLEDREYTMINLISRSKEEVQYCRLIFSCDRSSHLRVPYLEWENDRNERVHEGNMYSSNDSLPCPRGDYYRRMLTITMVTQGQYHRNYIKIPNSSLSNITPIVICSSTSWIDKRESAITRLLEEPSQRDIMARSNLSNPLMSKTLEEQIARMAALQVQEPPPLAKGTAVGLPPLGGSSSIPVRNLNLPK